MIQEKTSYQNELQFDFFSSNYLRFEEDFYRYSNLSIPLVFLSDDFLLMMAKTQTNYIRLNQANARDGRDHYFYFQIRMTKDNPRVRTYSYLGHSLTLDRHYVPPREED